ncbi:MAG: EF-P beta-lysylation protein EpmB [Proteobacteria bacterium]|nr:EF-P beta-lysylation protein EpmB [Pseudomonadota bacterium]
MKAIIPQPPLLQQSQTWQQALSEMVTCPHTLLTMLDLDPMTVPWQWDQGFPLRVSKSFISRMQKGNPFDPLLLQVLSTPIESQLDKAFSCDPLEESDYNPVPGLLHKYPSKVLLTFTSSCAIHCRYCFRRHFPYQSNNPGRKGWDSALDYIRSHNEIVEVILSGGDPLMANDESIKLFIQQLQNIPHIKILRIHTRLPVVIPERINHALISNLSSSRFSVVLVYHINHPNEIISSIAQGVLRLKQHNITVLNQSVLLKGVNDSLVCLKNLSISLFEAGILPYYVNLLDPVQGSKHFFVDIVKARQLQQDLRAALPGYLVPKFVQEMPHRLSKTALDLIP